MQRVGEEFKQRARIGWDQAEGCRQRVRGALKQRDIFTVEGRRGVKAGGG